MGVSVAVKIGIVGFGLLVATAAYEAYTRGDPPEVVAAQAAVSREIANKLLASLPADARWSGVTIEEARSGSYRLTLHYAAGRVGPPEIEADTKTVAQGMLLQLAMAGRHPSDERTAVAVSARQDEDGPALGAARFDPLQNRVVYEPPGR
jgi:hypothetical protein